jgi:hypothetical protein
MSISFVLVCILACSHSNAFLTPLVKQSPHKGIWTKRIPSSSSLSQSDEEEGSRRRFLVQTLFAAMAGLARSPVALADTLTKDLAKITTTANRKIGGLSNKIRSIANVMVG